MTRASASNTSSDKLDTSAAPPGWVKRTAKEPGSLVLRGGEWFEVQSDLSETPAKEKAPARRSGG